MMKRIVYGSAMALALLIVFWLEHRISHCTSAEAARYAPLLYGLPTLAVVWALTTVGFVELTRMGQSTGMRLLVPSGLIGMLVISALPKLAQIPPVTAALGWEPPGWLNGLETILTRPLLVVALVGIGVFFHQMCTRRSDGAFPRVAGTLLAVLYLGVGGAMILGLLMHWGLAWMIVVLSAVKLTDVGAYFAGSLFGRHKLVPWLSPSKSWEGLAGGLILAGAAGCLVGWAGHVGCLPQMHLSLARTVGLCVLLGLVGQFGDLCESLLKRSVGVKDAGKVVPHFGGVLDIIDSPLIAAPVAHVLLLVL